MDHSPLGMAANGLVVSISMDRQTLVTEAQARELISATFATAWVNAQPDVPLAVDNEVIALPDAGNFAALSIMLTTSSQMTQGGPGTRRVRRNGWAQAKLWVPAGTRTAGAGGLADTVRDILESKSFDSPITGDEALTTLGSNSTPPSEDGRWYTMVVRVPFWYAETK